MKEDIPETLSYGVVCKGKLTNHRYIRLDLLINSEQERRKFLLGLDKENDITRSQQEIQRKAQNTKTSRQTTTEIKGEG